MRRSTGMQRSHLGLSRNVLLLVDTSSKERPTWAGPRPDHLFTWVLDSPRWARCMSELGPDPENLISKPRSLSTYYLTGEDLAERKSRPAALRSLSIWLLCPACLYFLSLISIGWDQSAFCGNEGKRLIETFQQSISPGIRHLDVWLEMLSLWDPEVGNK